MFSHRAFGMRAASSAHAQPSQFPAPSMIMARLFLPLVLFGFTPSGAQAQFGKLKDMGARAAKEAAARKVIEAAGGEAASAGSSGSNSSSGRVSYDITAERLDAVLAAITPFVEEAKQREANKRQVAAFEAKRKTYEDCANAAAKRTMAVTPDNIAKSSEFTAKTVPMIERYTAISQDPSKKRETLMLQDSMQVLAVEAQLIMVGGKCGTPVYRTVAVVDAELAEMEPSGDGQIQVPAAQRAGMTTSQFGRIRERIALWALIQEGHAKPTEGRFTDAESQALQVKASELKSLAPFFRDGSLSWTNWGDLKGW
ncbi:MAG TPA: hypothetical protein VGE27_04525 [Gemmatimonas sp.]|uniref:hypothetical protein n=1 Tax=Gemmatimonas sp. TaxID=1962908 RepID=UPI002EDBAB97